MPKPLLTEVEPETTSISCDLLDTISMVDTQNKRDLILSKLKLSGEPYGLIGDEDFKNIIDFVNSKIDRQLIMKASRLNGLVFDKKTTGLNYTIVLLNDFITGKGKLFILTNRKYYDNAYGKMSKYPKKDPRFFLGSGVSKIAKVCVSLTLNESKELIASVEDVRLSYLVGIIKNDPALNDSYIASINEMLSKATSLDKVLEVFKLLQESSFVSDSTLKDYLIGIGEAENSALIARNGDVNCLDVSNPFIKINSDNQLVIKFYLFDRKSKYGSLGLKDGALVNSNDAAIILPKIIVSRYGFLESFEKDQMLASYDNGNVPLFFEDLIDQFLKLVSYIHERNIVHCDIKGKNLLLDREPDKSLKLRMIDFGSLINFDQILEGTKELLKLLGYTESSDGYIDGQLLTYRHLRPLLMTLRASPDKQSEYSKYAMEKKPQLTRFGLLEHIRKVIPDFRGLDFATSLTTGTHCSPEVYQHNRSAYAECINDNILSIFVVDKLGDDASKQLTFKIDKKHDVWAVGATIFELMFGRYVTFCPTDLAIIMANPVLLGMLHPDIECRFTIEQACEQRAIHPKIIIPTDQQKINELSSQYLELIYSLRRKLNKNDEKNDVLTLFDDINIFCSQGLKDESSGESADVILARKTKKNTLFHRLDSLIKDQDYLFYQKFLTEPGVDIGFLCEYLSDSLSRQKNIFSKFNIDLIFFYIKKYIVYLNENKDSAVVGNAMTQIYNIICFNLSMTEYDKKKMLTPLIFSLVRGDFLFNVKDQLILATVLIKLLNAHDIVNERNETLLHIILSSDYKDENAQDCYEFALEILSKTDKFPCPSDEVESCLDLCIKKKWHGLDVGKHDVLIKMFLRNNKSLEILDLESALFNAIIYDASDEIVRTILLEIVMINPSWNNYSLQSLRRPLIWQVCLSFNNNDALACYLVASGINSQQALELIFANISEEQVPAWIATLLTDKKIFAALNFDNQNNICTYLANNNTLCQIVKKNSGIVKRIIRDNKGKQFSLSPIQIHKMYLGDDIDSNAISVARENKNLGFFIFLFSEIISCLPCVLNQFDKIAQIEDVLTEMRDFYNIDLSELLEYLKYCTSTINPDIDWSFFQYCKRVLQEVKYPQYYLATFVTFSCGGYLQHPVTQEVKTSGQSDTLRPSV